MSDLRKINNTTEDSNEWELAGCRDEVFALTHPWIHHYELGVPASIIVPDQSLLWLLDSTSCHYPDHTAFLYYGTAITYAQFAYLTDCFARALQCLDVQKGDRVAIALPNIPQYPIAFYAALKVGAIVVPTNPLYTERELQYQLTDSGARVLVLLDTFYPLVRAIRAQTALEHIIVTSPADFLPSILHTLYPLSQLLSGQPAAHFRKDLHNDETIHVMHSLLKLESNELASQSPVAVSSNDIAVLQYTGGTTGLSKGAILTHHALLANTLQIRAWFPKIRDGEEVMLSVAPFFHAYGLTAGMNVSILLAATMVLLPRFKVKDVLKAIRRYRPTLFPGIPTMYRALLHEGSMHPNDLQSIKYCISGAAPLPASVRADFEAITHGKLVEGYGLSEAAPVTHCNPLTEECRDGSIGLPLPSVDATIANQETGEPVPVGELGEIMVKGPNMMLGYWQHEAESKAMFRDGWMRTGDLGRMDQDGFFYIVERIKDVIIASGFKVFPHEVEEVLSQHPFVGEAAVVGVPDEYRGETVAAFVVLKPEIEETEETRQELLQYCKAALTAYKVPKILVFRKSLPKSLIGKALRRELHV